MSVHPPANPAQAEVLEDLLQKLRSRVSAGTGLGPAGRTEPGSTSGTRTGAPPSGQGSRVTASPLTIHERVNVDLLPQAIVVGCYDSPEVGPRVWPRLFEPPPRTPSELESGGRWQWLTNLLGPPDMAGHRRGYNGALRSFVGGGLLILLLFVILSKLLQPLPAVIGASFLGGVLARNPWSGLMAPVFTIGLVSIFMGAFEYQFIAPIFQFSGLASVHPEAPFYLKAPAALTLTQSQNNGLMLPLLGMALLGGCVEWLRRKLRSPRPLEQRSRERLALR